MSSCRGDTVVSWMILALACDGPPEPADPVDAHEPPETGSDPGPVTDTDTVGPTATGDTGPAGEVDYPAVVPPAVDCATVVPSAPARPRSGGAPVPFDTRADGLLWFVGGSGVTEGVDPSTAALVYGGYAELVRQDPYGNLFWTSSGDIWRAPPGGAPALHATGMGEFPRVPRDLEAHPYGGVLVPAMEVGYVGGSFLHWVDPAGAVFTTEIPNGVLMDAAWAHDWRSLWMITREELWTVPVDPYGAPVSGAAPTLVAPLPLQQFEIGTDLTVDACGRLYLVLAVPLGPGRVSRYDPATGAFVDLPGIVFYRYGAVSPLRFGRAPGEETVLGTISATWGGVGHVWLLWDVGVGAPQWP